MRLARDGAPAQSHTGAMGANIDLVDQTVAAFNSGDVDAFCAFYTDDATLVAPDGTYSGREAITEMWTASRASFPDEKLTVSLTVEDGDKVVSEWTWTATNTGELTLPDGTTIPATGKSVSINGMDVVEIENGRVTSHRLYYDNMAAFAQLGLVEAPA
jgi:steroid delta-isomerase-like uncharacterized protein